MRTAGDGLLAGCVFFLVLAFATFTAWNDRSTAVSVREQARTKWQGALALAFVAGVAGLVAKTW